MDSTDGIRTWTLNNEHISRFIRVETYEWKKSIVKMLL
jgi:hypothetical protein